MFFISKPAVAAHTAPSVEADVQRMWIEISAGKKVTRGAFRPALAIEDRHAPPKGSYLLALSIRKSLLRAQIGEPFRRDWLNAGPFFFAPPRD
jgi:hypothetical protein